MKKQFLNILKGGVLLLAMATMAVSCKKDVSQSAADKVTMPEGTASSTTPRALTLVWSDEFNGSAVDGSKWNIDNGNPNVNNEKEYYQAANAAVTGGNLVIRRVIKALAASRILRQS